MTDHSKIHPDEVRDEYNNIERIWAENDLWHKYTHLRIERFIKKHSKKYIKNSYRILNLGSGGNNHCLNEDNMLHVDIAEKKISYCKNYLVSDIHHINIQHSHFDVILCVGSVINYCDPSIVIKEIKRLSKKNTILILEFESSSSFEFLFTKNYKKNASIVSSFYQHRNEKIWVYSAPYIKNILSNNHFKIITQENFHILTPFIYLLTQNSNISSMFSCFDPIVQYIPFIKNHSCNIILLASSV